MYFGAALGDALFYFASEHPGDKPGDVIQRIATRVQECAKDLDLHDAAVAHEHLYGESLRWGSQSEVRRFGEVGELVRLRSPKAKAVLKSLVGLWLGAPKTWRPVARNDSVAMSDVKKSADVCEWAYKEMGLEVFLAECAESGAVFKEVYALPSWDASKGGPVAVDFSMSGGSLVWSGGLTIRMVQKWDCFFDRQYRSWEDVPWVCVRTYENRHDLAALHPEQADAIRSASDDWLKPGGKSEVSTRRGAGKDVVGVLNFFHRPSPAVGESGLCVRFISGDVPLGQPTPCESLPVKRFAPATQLDSTHGDSQWVSILGLQQMFDRLHSAVQTNYDAYAEMSVEMPSDMVVSANRAAGVKVYERPPGMPPGQVQPLVLAREIPGAGETLGFLKSEIVDGVGLNDVSQGQPDSAQMNAQAFAILKSAATERNALSQRRLLDFLGQLGAAVLKLLAENMGEEDVITIAGRTGSFPATQVRREQLLGDGVYVEVGSALEQSVEGRMQIVEYGLKAGAIKDASGVVETLRTGRYPDEVNRVASAKALIKWENEEILAGKVPTVYFTHDHLQHCVSHACVGDNPAALGNDAALKALKAHVDWHYQQFYGAQPQVGPDGQPGQLPPPEADPQYPDRLRILLGQQAPGQVGPPPMGAPSGTPPPAQGESSSSAPPTNGVPSALSPETEQEVPATIVPTA